MSAPTTCPTGKIGHASRGAARVALRRARARRDRQRSYTGHVERGLYRCPWCPCWHLTSSPWTRGGRG